MPLPDTAVAPGSRIAGASSRKPPRPLPSGTQPPALRPPGGGGAPHGAGGEGGGPGVAGKAVVPDGTAVPEPAIADDPDAVVTVAARAAAVGGNHMARHPAPSATMRSFLCIGNLLQQRSFGDRGPAPSPGRARPVEPLPHRVGSGRGSLYSFRAIGL